MHHVNSFCIYSVFFLWDDSKGLEESQRLSLWSFMAALCAWNWCDSIGGISMIWIVAERQWRTQCFFGCLSRLQSLLYPFALTATHLAVWIIWINDRHAIQHSCSSGSMTDVSGVVNQLTASNSQGTPTATYVHSVVRSLHRKRKVQVNRIQILQAAELGYAWEVII